VIGLFILTISDVAEASNAVLLFSLELLVDEPEGVNVAGNVAEDGQEDVDEQVASAASDEGHSGRRKDDSDEDEENVRALDHFVRFGVGIHWMGVL